MPAWTFITLQRAPFADVALPRRDADPRAAGRRD
jgi:hypothetical protein